MKNTRWCAHLFMQIGKIKQKSKGVVCYSDWSCGCRVAIAGQEHRTYGSLSGILWNLHSIAWTSCNIAILKCLSCSHTYTLGADPGGSATDVVRHCPPWSVLIRHHPPSSQSHYGGYARFYCGLGTNVADGGLAADWRTIVVLPPYCCHGRVCTAQIQIRPEAQLCWGP